MSDAELEEIWTGDFLGRRQEAALIEAYLRNETDAFSKMGRNRSVVLAIDAPYGHGKTWFIERLTRQLALSHPVAFLDAWAEDVGDEPLAAFMVAVEDAVQPFLKKRSEISENLQAVKAAAMPIIGKLALGALTKALTKLAGDQIQDQLGDVLEEAVQGQELVDSPDEDAAAAQAAEAGIEAASQEIEKLADRRGAAVLSAYRQKRESRLRFQKSMQGLVKSLGRSEQDGAKPPLIVMIDELDRCRPVFAIKMLEEIKHFFEIDDIVFVICLYGDQLEKSINAIYGNDFNGKDYLRRFFTRTYRLSEAPIISLVSSLFDDWKFDKNRFHYPEKLVSGEEINVSNAAGLILHDLKATPREAIQVIDCLRLFLMNWRGVAKLDLIVLLVYCLQQVRNIPFTLEDVPTSNNHTFYGVSWDASGTSGTPKGFSVSGYINNIRRANGREVAAFAQENPYARDPAYGQVVGNLIQESRRKGEAGHLEKFPLTDISYFPNALATLSGFS